MDKQTLKILSLSLINHGRNFIELFLSPHLATFSYLTLFPEKSMKKKLKKKNPKLFFENL